jgi:SPP1 family predicted phage head-tail adaptor
VTAVRTGALNRRITIQTRSTSQDSWGQQVTTWTDAISCWAQVEPLEGRELQMAMAINVSISHRITILYRSSVTAAQRVVYQGRILNITAVLDVDTAHEQLQLLCGEGLNQG